MPPHKQEVVEGHGDRFDACFADQLAADGTCPLVLSVPVPVVQLPLGSANSKANVPQPEARHVLTHRLQKDFTELVVDFECSTGSLAANPVTHGWKS